MTADWLDWDVLADGRRSDAEEEEAYLAAEVRDLPPVQLRNGSEEERSGPVAVSASASAKPLTLASRAKATQ